MAARNVKTGQGFDPTEKLQSNTLKRQPNPDWSKADLLRLLSYFEGELQAKDVTIAALRAEKAKQCLYQAKYGRFGLGDPLMALQRDSDGMKDNSFDEAAIKSMYDNQLAQLENLIATQRKAQLKMREQLATAEKRYQKVLTELEEEKRKHAQDTAQGDDVTYMLEKERERLNKEIDFEKTQNKRFEKDLKKTLASLEEERANSAKHKQVAIMLIKERKRFVEKIMAEQQKSNQYENKLTEEKGRMVNMAEGLMQETKKSLQMEAAMEKLQSEFDIEREQLKAKLSREETRNRELSTQNEALQLEVDSLQRKIHSLLEKTASHDALQSIEIRSSASQGRISPGRNSPSFSSPGAKPVVKASKPGMEGMKVGGDVPDRGAGRPGVPVDRGTAEVSPTGAPARVNLTPGSSATVALGSGAKVSLHVGGSQQPPQPGPGSPRRVASAGRGAPPPIPPNKPTLPPGTPQGQKPTPPPKVGVVLNKGASGEVSTSASKPVQIPVNVVGGGGGQAGAAGSRSPAASSRDASPLRKPQSSSATPVGQPSPSSHSPVLDFLGPDLANLQQLLASMTTGQTSSSDSSSVATTTASSCSASATNATTTTTTATVSATTIAATATTTTTTPATSPLSLSQDIKSSPLHYHAASGNLSVLASLVLERDADVNLPLKDGTTPAHCAAQSGKTDCLKLLLDRGSNPNALQDNRTSPLHLAAGQGHARCIEVLIACNATVNIGDAACNTPLHLAAQAGHVYCCHKLLEHGADLFCHNMAGLTALHLAVLHGHSAVLEVLLVPPSSRWSGAKLSIFRDLLKLTSEQPGADGLPLLHTAATLAEPACLKLLSSVVPLDPQKPDKQGVTLLDVASPACQDFLQGLQQPATLEVLVELQMCSGCVSLDPCSPWAYVIGRLKLGARLEWAELEEELQKLLTQYWAQLDSGMKSIRLSRLEMELSPNPDPAYSLGLRHTSQVKAYATHFYSWSPGEVVNQKPYEVLCNTEEKKINIIMEGSPDTSETIAFETLHPVQVIQNYLRLLEQYKCAIFYGAAGCGKSFLTHRLAQCLAARERLSGHLPVIHTLPLNSNFTNQDFIHFLCETGCLVPAGGQDGGLAPIVLLEDIETVNLTELLGDLLHPLEHRGPQTTVTITGSLGTRESHYFTESFYLIGTMNKTRSIGLDLSIQQRLRWVHTRLDTEPMRNLLARHFQRQLLHVCGGLMPQLEDEVFRAAEWIISICHRLNNCLGKLEQPDLAFGPALFLSCPLQTRSMSSVLKWMQELWNEHIAPVVSLAVRRGAGDVQPEGQQKVASTALFVLIQRSVSAGCPLSGAEKEQYLSHLTGSNELHLPVKGGKGNHSRSPTSSSSTGKRSSGHAAVSGHRMDVLISGMKNRDRLRYESYGPSIGLNSSIKRRSLSESSVARTEEPADVGASAGEEAKEPQQSKVLKLEVRSPLRHGAAPSQSSRSSLGALTDRLSAPAMVGQKSRSSENISLSGLNSPRFRLPSTPFSFSFATPTSGLSSFKTLQVPTARSGSARTVSLKGTSSPSAYKSNGSVLRKN